MKWPPGIMQNWICQEDETTTAGLTTPIRYEVAIGDRAYQELLERKAIRKLKIYTAENIGFANFADADLSDALLKFSPEIISEMNEALRENIADTNRQLVGEFERSPYFNTIHLGVFFLLGSDSEIKRFLRTFYGSLNTVFHKDEVQNAKIVERILSLSKKVPVVPPPADGSIQSLRKLHPLYEVKEVTPWELGNPPDSVDIEKVEVQKKFLDTINHTVESLNTKWPNTIIRVLLKARSGYFFAAEVPQGIGLQVFFGIHREFEIIDSRMVKMHRDTNVCGLSGRATCNEGPDEQVFINFDDVLSVIIEYTAWEYSNESLAAAVDVLSTSLQSCSEHIVVCGRTAIAERLSAA